MNFVIKSVACMAIASMSAAVSAQTAQQRAASGAAQAEAHTERGLNAAGLSGYPLYGEVGLGLLSYKISRIGVSARPVIARAVVGYDLHPMLAIEGMLGFGLGGAGISGVYGTAYNLSTGTLFGAYAKPRLRIGGETEVFGRLGFANTGSSVRGYTGTTSGAGLSYGLGFKTGTGLTSLGNRPISVSADYMSYYSGSGVKFNGFTVSAGMRF